jgi:D-threo-aldose 1-dehydrogenase
VGAIGAGMEDTALLTTLVRETNVEVLMLPGRYTLLDQSALDGLSPACQERGVSVISAAVFHAGVLAQNGREPERRLASTPAVGGPGSSTRSAEEVRQNVNSFCDACTRSTVERPLRSWVARRASTDTFLAAQRRRFAGAKVGRSSQEDMTNPPDTPS